MIQKASPVSFRHVKRKWLADKPSARATEKLRRRKVDLFDSTDTVETDISNWRQVEKIDVASNGRFQFCLGMLEDWRVCRWLQGAVFSDRPISRKFPPCTRRCLFHVRM